MKENDDSDEFHSGEDGFEQLLDVFGRQIFDHNWLDWTFSSFMSEKMMRFRLSHKTTNFLRSQLVHTFSQQNTFTMFFPLT